MPPDGATLALARAATGELPPNLALMHLLLASESEGEATAALASARDGAQGAPADRLAALAAIWKRTPQAWSTVASVAATVDHAPDRVLLPSGWAASFDAAARIDADAAGALYALGSTELLDAATAEIVGFLGREGALDGRTRVLDLGCGAGRLAAALAPRVAAVVGLDVSATMLRAARQRCGSAANIVLVRGGGTDLGPLADRSLDLVVAVDSVPYLVASRVVGRMIGECARALRPGGRLAILNFAYGTDFAADRAALAGLGAAQGLALRRAATGDFALWDARSFLLTRA